MSPPTSSSGQRVSLACIPCRSRHVRCDATQPICARCSSDGRTCQYAKSRRGGLDRAALARLAERRARAAVAEGVGRDGDDGNTRASSSSSSLRATRNNAGARMIAGQDNTTPENGRDDEIHHDVGSGDFGLVTPPGLVDRYSVSSGRPSVSLHTSPPSETQTRGAANPATGQDDPASDPFISLYYSSFHHFHPCLLPRQFFLQYHRTASDDGRRRLNPLLAVMRYIGCRYAGQTERTQHSNRLLTHIHDSLEEYEQQQPHNHTGHPFQVQFHLLHAIALFWSEQEPEAQNAIEKAGKMAVGLGMFKQDFATSYIGEGISTQDETLGRVVQESYRRTWWQLFIVDAYLAATMRTFKFRLARLSEVISADLPCEEGDYEVGSIPPTPRTLDEFGMREFASDDEKETFSSFAYLVSAIRSVVVLAAMRTAPPSVSLPTADLSLYNDGKAMWQAISTTGDYNDDDADRQLLPPWEILDELNAIVNGWILLLPEEKKKIVSADGRVDELMFQGLMVVHTAVIALHRPFSDLQFNPLESISSCSNLPPENRPPREAQAIHTQRVLSSIEAHIRLLSLPLQTAHHPNVIHPSSSTIAPPQTTTPPSSSSLCPHTPFLICMISTGTVPLLSACVSIYNTSDQKNKLAQARERIRLSIGCLKSFAESWDRGKRNLGEIQTIARHVLGGGAGKGVKPPAPVVVAASSRSQLQTRPRSTQLPSQEGTGQITMPMQREGTSTTADAGGVINGSVLPMANVPAINFDTTLAQTTLPQQSMLHQTPAFLGGKDREDNTMMMTTMLIPDLITPSSSGSSGFSPPNWPMEMDIPVDPCLWFS